MARAIRISKKSLAALPQRVAETVQDMAARFPNVKSFRLYREPEGYTFYAREGCTYRIVRGDEAIGFEMVAQHNLGGSGMSHDIGYTREMPAGTWIVAMSDGYGGYSMSITNVGYRALEG